jgi:hypothetical protein
VLTFNGKVEAARALAATLKQHHEYRSVKHYGSRVFYEWKGQQLVAYFDESAP